MKPNKPALFCLIVLVCGAFMNQDYDNPFRNALIAILTAILSLTLLKDRHHE